MPGMSFCKVLCKERLCSDIFKFTISSSRIALEARAGQFVHIKCGSARILRRPISISGITDGTFEIVFEVKGEGTRWLSKREPGSVLDILGPLGNGFRVPEGKVIAVGGGIGAPPLLFAGNSIQGGMTAILGFRSAERVILTDDFKSACEELIVTTDDGSFGRHGPVTLPLEELIRSGQYDAVLACGPDAMLSAVAGVCKTHGVPCQVSLEEKMGCGVGACLVCACATINEGIEEMSRVCADGPVFDADNIIWNA